MYGKLNDQLIVWIYSYIWKVYTDE